MLVWAERLSETAQRPPGDRALLIERHRLLCALHREVRLVWLCRVASGRWPLNCMRVLLQWQWRSAREGRLLLGSRW